MDAIYLDYAKAFDTVPHKRLLAKLSGYGIGGKLLKWIAASLEGRRQRVIVNGSKSPWTYRVTNGIPQGSVLGPLLFVGYVNDMPENITSTAYMFADDSKVYRNTKTHIKANMMLGMVRVETRQRRNNFRHRTVNRWNSVTEEVVSAPSLSYFKSILYELWRGSYSYVQQRLLSRAHTP